jgi:gliding motility-associated-like protein
MKNYFTGLLMVIILIFGAQRAWATHIVGGEVTYKCLSPGRYEVRVDIYQDCINGAPDAIAQDRPAIIAIFEGNGRRVILDDSVEYAFRPIRVPVNFSNSCINNPPATCLQQASFIAQYNLPPNSTGYYIVYQRCCRNGQVNNISRPSEVGATYYAIIPPSGTVCNNSAVFRNYPPQIICINNPLFYDHSATDTDGDSLSYEFCTAYDGGNANDAKPVPSSIAFSSVPYVPGYSAASPMGGFPPIRIDPATGLITGTPNQTGRYVVTVCCNEWREGVLINTVKREFQFVVTNCSRAVVANIPQYSEEFNTYIVQCNSRTVSFDNLSTGGFAYSWDFGVPGATTDTSSEFEPTFTYPDTGVYFVKLVVNRGSTCPDSITRIVKVYPDFNTDFSVSGIPCPKTPIPFTDLTTATYQPINYWRWDFGDSTISNEQNPRHAYDTGGRYNVVLISKNVKGCVDTARKEINVENFIPFSGVRADTFIVKGERIQWRATGGSEYTWIPSTYLDNPNIPNPVGYYPDLGSIIYIVHVKSNAGCEGDDTVKVTVVNQSTLFVPSGFTPNGDGKNDILRPIGIGYRNINYFRVYNRWGQNVFYTIYFGQGWDGNFQGRPQDAGTYFWQLSTIDRFGKEEKMMGDAILIR